MGGIGSGRYWRWDTKETTEDYRSIDIRRWHRERLLIPNQSFSRQWISDGEVASSISVRVEKNKIYLIYRQRNHDKNWVDKHYPIYLAWTSCNYGNSRPWFLCPICGRRVAILYSGKIFACRQCYQLAYPSQRETFPFRAARQVDKIRERLNWESRCLNSCGLKPKGMHTTTFKRLLTLHNAYVSQALSWMT